MSRPLTPEQRTQLTDLIAAELTLAHTAAVAAARAAGTDPLDLGRAIAVRVTALEAIAWTDRT
jgi:hypothetical protein